MSLCVRVSKAYLTVAELEVVEDVVASVLPIVSSLLVDLGAVNLANLWLW